MKEQRFFKYKLMLQLNFSLAESCASAMPFNARKKKKMSFQLSEFAGFQILQGSNFKTGNLGLPVVLCNWQS